MLGPFLGPDRFLRRDWFVLRFDFASILLLVLPSFGFVLVLVRCLALGLVLVLSVAAC